MNKPHATPTRYEPERSARTETLRTVVLPVAGAIALVVLFFVLLLSTPGAHKPTPTAAEPVASVDRPSAVAPALPDPNCLVPQATGQVGVVARHFSGKPTSSGEPYDPDGVGCIVNIASVLGALSYGTEVELRRTDAPDQTVPCKVIGRWRGEKFTDRLLLVSSSIAERLEVGDRGLIEVTTDCATGSTADAQPGDPANLG